MTPQNRQSYKIINVTLAGLFGLIFVYSGFFSPIEGGHFIPSACDLFNLTPCPSKGLSRSFSAMMQGNLSLARELNSMGPRIFLFFILQLLLRGTFFLLIPKIKKNTYRLLWADISISLILFITCFYPFFEFWGAVYS